MPFSENTAKTLIAHIEESGNKFMSFLPQLEIELSPEEFQVVKREIGRIIATMDNSLSAKIAFQFPELAPEAVPIAHEILKGE